jgi:glycosyltransferase involved in cell wall biosynthesis
MPTHNRSILLKRAIESVLNQSYKNIELIVVNDGSSDDTVSILDVYKEKHGVKVIHVKEPNGACHARNLAIESANGYYITGIDDDDEILPNHISSLLDAYNDKFSFVASSILEDMGGKLVKRNFNVGVIKLDSLLHYNKVGNQVFTLTSRMRDVGGFDVELPAFQDYDLWVRLVHSFGDGLKLKQCTYILHTSHELGRISQNNSKRLKALGTFVSKHQRLMTSRHLNSIQLLRIRMLGRRLTLKSFFMLTNSSNFVSSMTFLINSYIPDLIPYLQFFRKTKK